VLNVVVLVFHFLFVIVENLNLHVFDSMLDFVSVTVNCLFVWSVLTVVFQMASGIFGAPTLYSMTNIMMEI
jgi:hypothetical protein